ncbi:hypothetical protein [Propylenella binzhouense]|uniref:YARHG domain-containing protein n=1 Tax=Propylenella binzhouense TaxID=2555902 RepID=A0A964T4S8_9HYPH|nr:hypothetical protein [Propylenella binzhouense]MYZ48390.1 hypothetical protein [Propylenella binzhouense]
MNRVATAALAAAILALPAAAEASFLSDLLRYEPRVKPPTADCTALAAEIGPQAVWRGHYAGKFHDFTGDKNRAYAAEGCFPSEAACRVWQQRSITYAVGPIIATSCRRGL